MEAQLYPNIPSVESSGKRGQRQRETHARLKTDAMKKPFEVIVMRDVPEPKEDLPSSRGSEVSLLPHRSTGISASEILEVEDPSMEEVAESIESLRPESTILEEEQYNHLVKELMDGYNLQQLFSYLTHVLRLDSIDADSVKLLNQEPSPQEGRLKRSTWRPGRTPLQQRRTLAGILKKSEIGTNKTKLANQIMRLAWNLTIHSEMQSVGELEVTLTTWQMRYLFDLSLGGLPIYYTMITSTLLQRNAQVRPYRPDNIMRITARRQDAEEIAEQIERQLQEVAQLEINLGVFRKVLSRPGWPKYFEVLFDESALNEIERATTTVIYRKNFKTLRINGRSVESTQHARRLLLSLLNLPSPRSVEITDEVAASQEVEKTSGSQAQLLLPDHASSNVHLWKQNHKFGRLTLPSPRAVAPPSVDREALNTQNGDGPNVQDHKVASTERSIHSQRLIDRLSTFNPVHAVDYQATGDPDSYWLPKELCELRAMEHAVL